MAEMSDENMIIFRTPEDPWGEFTNQYPSPFIYRGTRFETVEQFLYYMRAVFGRSAATAEKILACGGDSAALIKASKKQRILETNTWEMVRPQIMRRGMRQKFLQNPDLRRKLLSTGYRLLVEVPKEGLLGRILPGNEDWYQDPEKWKKRNQTGRILMQVRADLRCADRLVGPDEAYIFPKEPFILQMPIGQMTLKEIAALPGAREAVLAYAWNAQQYMYLSFSNADDFINRKEYPLTFMEQAIARNRANIERALSLAGSAAPDKTIPAAPEANTSGPVPPEAAAPEMHIPGPVPPEAAADKPAMPSEMSPELSFASPDSPMPAPPNGPVPAPPDGPVPAPPDGPVPAPADPADPAAELPDDIPAEGFYELLYDLEEMVKLGIL